MNLTLKRILALLLLVLVLSLAALARAQDVTPEPTADVTPEATPPTLSGAGGYTVRQQYRGVERSFHVYIPKIYEQAAQPVALIIVLHGAGGTGGGIESFSGFDALADKQAFIVIYPDGLDLVWNDGRRGDPRVGSQDDVGFLGSTITFLSKSLNIDPNRVYVTGYSMGAMLSYRMACDLPSVIAAVAPVASTFPEYQLTECAGTPPVPLLVIQGTDDPVVPWAGVQGGYLSAAQTLSFWKLHNGCKTDQGMTMLDDTAPDDGTRIIVEGYTGCQNDADVQVDSVFHGGHTWPGHTFDVPFDLGKTSMDIDAPQVIWDFFQKHPRNGA
jgi:polyhydroxybutyrate depolymerase